MTKTSREYASALFELARETGSEKEFKTAMQTILKELNENPEYVELLSTPSLPINERLDLLETAFYDCVPEYVMSLTEILCRRGRLQELGEISKEYDELYKAFESVSIAKIVTAVPLTEQEKSELVSQLEKKSGHSVTPQYEIDKSLLGGAVVYMDGTVTDGSLKNKLKQVKEVIGK